MKLVNKKDLFWSKSAPFSRHCYIVRLANTEFGVNADCLSDALDYVMDYISSHRGYKGFWRKPTDEDLENESTIFCGNFGYVLTVADYELSVKEISHTELRALSHRKEPLCQLRKKTNKLVIQTECRATMTSGTATTA